MTQPKPRLKFTVKDYMSMPEDGKRYQLLDGEMVLAPSPTTRHQIILGRLHILLTSIFADRGLGLVVLAPLDVVLSDHDVAQPDLLFVSNERSGIVEDANVQGAPDLVVEILSPSTAAYDQGYKLALYGRHGVREYWLVDPNAETVQVFTEGEQGLDEHASYGDAGRFTTPLTQGTSIDFARLFRAD